jgi:thiol-disulfide isomerase/thioredoxin
MRPAAAAFACMIGLTTIMTAAPTDRPDPIGVKIGDAAPRLDFHLLSNGKFPRWESLRGRVVVMDFWATWCAPCVGAIPALNELHRDFAGKDVTFMSVTYEPERHVWRFLGTHPIDGEVGIDDSLATFKSFQAWGIPVVYVFGRDGRLLSAVHPKNLTADVLTAALRGEVPDVKQSIPWSDPRGAEEYFRKNQRELREKEASSGH